MAEPPEGEDKKRPTPVREGLDQRDEQGERPPPARVPTPVRSLEPPPPARPAPAPPPPGAQRPAPARPPEPGREAAPEAVEAPPAPEEARPLAFRLGEQEWVARVEGYGQSGSCGDPGAPLMALSFARGADPERPLFETLCTGRSLEALTEDRLVELLAGARPVADASDRSEIFSETRVRKKEL